VLCIEVTENYVAAYYGVAEESPLIEGWLETVAGVGRSFYSEK